MLIAHRLLLLVLGTLFFASQTKAVAITGPQGGVDSATGQRPFRQDINTFQNSGPAFDLYILSFQRFVQQNQSDLLSYYQVAGKCHFVPRVNGQGSRHLIVFLQAFMATRTPLGTASVDRTTWAIVRMARFFFPPGIGRIWLCLRSVGFLCLASAQS